MNELEELYTLLGQPDPDATRISTLCSEPTHGLAYDDPLWGRMVFVPHGYTICGSDSNDPMAQINEKPRQLVEVPAFWIAQYPTTLKQWAAANGPDGSVTEDGSAVVCISWNEVQATLSGLTPAGSSLRVFRGGSWRDDSSICRSAFRFWNEPANRYTNLGFRPARTVPAAGSTGSRAFRGGSWYGAASYCRASLRYRYTPDYRYYGLGFRVVLSPPQDSSLPSSVLLSYRLPLEDEFERAARGWDGRIYPWGNAWIEDRTERLAKPSPFGIYGLCGEVWQWCQDEYIASRPSMTPLELLAHLNVEKINHKWA